MRVIVVFSWGLSGPFGDINMDIQSPPLGRREASILERGSFQGSGSEYFGIWIVNVILTILTLGIYSAWAKVRRKRYFLGNTYVAGHSFDYHAKPKQILIGRLIVFAYAIAFNVTAQFMPIVSGILGLAMIFLLPWIFMRSLRFNARVTSYRNVRFEFTGSLGGAFLAVFAGGLITVLSLGILAPLASRWLYRYVFDNLRYGDRPFRTTLTLGSLYRVWFVPFFLVIFGTIGVIIVLTILGVLFGGLLLPSADQLAEGNFSQATMIVITYAAALPFLAVYFAATTFYRIGVRNVVMNAAVLDEKHALFSYLSRSNYFWIVFSNIIVTVFSLGLMRPWAAVREARYLAEYSGIYIDGDLDGIVSSIQTTSAAVTAEYMDLEGFDFGF